MTRSVSANGAAAVLILLSGCSQSVGCNDISGLEKDIRRGQAEKNGLPVSVRLFGAE